MADDGKTGTTIAPWEVLESKYAYRDRWLALRSDTVRLPNGRVLSPYHIIEQADWVAAVALTTEGKIVLVEEYRHGAQQVLIELPGGIHDKPEEPLAAIKRELLEETGFAGDDWRPIGSFFTNPPRVTNRVHCFLALDVRKVAEPRLDDSEVLHTHEIPLETFLADVRTGRHAMHGFQLGVLWLLHTYAVQSGDRRLLAAAT